MDGEPQPRGTIALAVGAIVAAVSLFLVGAVSGQVGGVIDAAAVAGIDGSHDHDDASEDETAAAASTGPGDDEHAHDEPKPEPEATDESAAGHAHDVDVDVDADVVAVVVPATGDAHTADADHDHGAVPATTPTTVHDHGTMPTTTVPGATTTTMAPTGPVISLDDARLTEDQRNAARTLLDATRAALAALPDEAAVIAAGYVSIGDGVTGFEHYVHVGHLGDGIELDATRIESIVLRVSDGAKAVASAMYILTTGKTMADVPEIAGELTTWHDHQNLCWEGVQVVAIRNADGTCPRGQFRPTAPMLHVWATDQPCGPFSGIEGTHGGGCHDH